jgi:hypothetical protein
MFYLGSSFSGPWYDWVKVTAKTDKLCQVLRQKSVICHGILAPTPKRKKDMTFAMSFSFLAYTLPQVLAEKINTTTELDRKR